MGENMDLKGTMTAAALAVAAAIPASAASLYNLEATPLAGSSGFSLVFEDLDGDMLFSLDELLSFSGITDNFGDTFTILASVPTVVGFTDGGILPSPTPPFCTGFWCFEESRGNGTSTPATSFSLDISVVPLPAGLPLLLTGLAGFAGLRMRQKRKAQA